MVARPPANKVAALTILRYSPDSASELSLQQHLNIAPDLLANYDRIATDGVDSDESMMAQAVPHQTQQPDRRRVKVYELRDNDWFDRGTGFCSAEFIEVRLDCPMLSRFHSPLSFMCPKPARLLGVVLDSYGHRNHLAGPIFSIISVKLANLFARARLAG